MEQTVTASGVIEKFLDAHPVATFAIDAQHRIIHWNKACEEVLGIEAAAMLGSSGHWKAFYNSPRPTLADLIVDGRIDANASRLYNDKLLRRSGSISGAFEALDFFPHLGAGGRWLAFTAAPICDEQGAVIAAVETLQDVTDRQRAEQGLRNARDRLEFEVAARTAELAESNQRLIESLRRAEEANQLKTSFLRILSHELKTPLHGIIGLSQLIVEASGQEDTVAHARLILESGETLFHHLDEMLHLAELEAGFGRLAPIPCSPADLLEAAMHRYHDAARQKGIEIVCDIAARVPDVLMVDAARLDNCLSTLIDNAVKFTDAGRIDVLLDFADGRLRLKVTDTGPGIPVEYREEVFDKFRQVDPFLIRRHGGLGIGLAVARAQAELLGGELRLLETEQGACFEMTVPVGDGVR